MSVHLSTHFGFERVAFEKPSHSPENRAAKTGGVRMLSNKRLSNVILVLLVMAAVTLTERMLDPTKTSFALEWAVLSLVAMVTFTLLANVVFRITSSARAWLVFYIAEARETRAEQELVWLAKGDRRVLDDIRAARDRQEWVG